MTQHDTALYGSAQDYLTAIEFGPWYRFDEIPDEIFNQVFELIDEGWRWKYTFDEFDQSFKKDLS